jgi:hypothetical protein
VFHIGSCEKWFQKFSHLGELELGDNIKIKLKDIECRILDLWLARSVTEALCSQRSSGLLTSLETVGFLRKSAFHGVRFLL